MFFDFKKTKSINSPTLGRIGKAEIYPARVIKSMINATSQPTAFKELGEYQSIGGVFYASLNNPNPEPVFTSDNFATPLFSNMSNVPLENEIIYIINLPGTNIQSNVNSIIPYYFQPINIWNSIHHNAIPDPLKPVSGGAQEADYTQAEGGLTRQVTDGGTEITLGKTFNERIDTRKLQPFEGDIIYEGRWGQSVRFGSTISGSAVPNPWSSTGPSGDPLTILRNGQHEEDSPPWVPQVENINTDPSSIYLTSTQLIPINAASTSYFSYSNPPIAPNQYDKEQIILNSGRLLLNSKNDSILLSSSNTINLNAVNNVNIDTNSVAIKSKKIALGDKNASEPIILGNKFLEDFADLCKDLNSVATALQAGVGTPGNLSPPLLGLIIPVVELANSSANMLSKIKQYKSTVTTTK
tara:strand:- start:29 stop:1261 length:1233 start_codon:yes stop_codon:yes gene_type:complete